MLRTHKPLERFVHLVVKRHAKKMLTTLAFVLTLCIAPVLAQEGRHRPGDLPNPNIQGTFYVRGTPGIQPRTFEELCRRSSLILDGTVSESLPARRSDPTIPISLETDVVLTVNQMFKGPQDLSRVMVNQVGGTQGRVQVIFERDVLMLPGERYILFLIPEDRTNLPVITGIPRYSVIGAWGGKFLVDNGSIRVMGNAPTQVQAQFKNSPVAEFVNAIRAIVRN